MECHERPKVTEAERCIAIEFASDLEQNVFREAQLRTAFEDACFLTARAQLLAEDRRGDNVYPRTLFSDALYGLGKREHHNRREAAFIAVAPPWRGETDVAAPVILACLHQPPNRRENGQNAKKIARAWREWSANAEKKCRSTLPGDGD